MTPAPTLSTERHYTPTELSALWSVSPSYVRRLFQDEPGVLKLGAAFKRGKRGYVTLRIPESIVSKIYLANTR